MASLKEIEDKYHEFLPPKNEIVNKENFKLFFKAMYERQESWYNRFVLCTPQPWTKDKIISQYSFTNVYRELDRCSQYLIHNYLTNSELSLTDKIFAIFVYRIFNKPETFKDMQIPRFREYDEDAWLAYLKTKVDNQEDVLNQQAYKINTYFDGGVPRYIAYTKKILTPLHNKVEDIYWLLTNDVTKNDEVVAADIIKQLTSINYLGNFLAHEYFIDMCYLAKYNKIRINVNENSYTNVGPGCCFGIRLIFPSFTAKEQKQAIYWLRDMAEEELSMFTGCFKYTKWSKKEKEYVPSEFNITLHQIEMFLCELSKYWKVLNGVGKQRQKFVPKTKK